MPDVTIRLTANEHIALRAFFRSNFHKVPTGDPNWTDLIRVFGRLEGGHSPNDITLEESRALLPKGWYISKTGRRLKCRPDGVPITPKKYDEISEAAILRRGMVGLGIIQSNMNQTERVMALTNVLEANNA